MTDAVSTGDPVFDTALNGGIPEGSAVLLTGGPGTGKTTAAMQFLQAGLDNGEQCIFLSTEQAVSDLRRGLESFEFDLDHPNLTLTTIHAAHGESTALGESGLVMRTLDGESPLDTARSVPFTPPYIQQYLEKLGPADRVVLDSASGLAAVTQDQAQYRRVMIDVIRQFKTQFGATSLLTAQDYAQQDDTVIPGGTLSSSLALQFTADGVVRLWQDELEGEYHRFIHITKMRGVDHDLRPYEMRLEAEGVRLKPLNRSPPAVLSAKARTTTGLPGLDELLGGGFITGSTISYQYASCAHADFFLSKAIDAMVTAGRTVVLVPPPTLTYEQLDEYLTAHADRPLEAYLADASLRVVDAVSAGRFLPDGMKSEAVEAPQPDELVQRLRQIQYQADTPVTQVISCQTTQMYAEDDILRKLISGMTTDVRGTDDTVLFTSVPELLDQRARARLENVSEQVLAHKRQPNGMESLRLRKGLGGEVGSSRVVEYYEDPPYLAIS